MLATAVGERARADLLFALFTREAEIEPALPFNPSGAEREGWW